MGNQVKIHWLSKIRQFSKARSQPRHKRMKNIISIIIITSFLSATSLLLPSAVEQGFCATPNKTTNNQDAKQDTSTRPFLKNAYQGPIRFPRDINETKKIRWIAENNAMVITRHATLSQIQKLKKYNHNLKVLQYINIKGVKDRELEQPFFQEVKKNNLFARTSDGQKIQHRHYKWYLVDIVNQKWPEAIIRVLSGTNPRYAMATYDGVMLDDTSLTYPAVLSAQPIHDNPATIYEGYRSILQRIREAFPEKIIVFNGYCHWVGKPGSQQGLEKLTGIDFIKTVDGISFETVTRNFQGKSYGAQRIIRHLQDFQTAGTDKAAAFVELGDHDNTDQRIFSLATYLLVQNQNSFYNYSGQDISSHLQPYPEYYLDIGTPEGPLVRNHFFLQRNFSQGQVFVNLGNRGKTIKIPQGTYRVSVQGGGTWEDKGKIVFEIIQGNTLIPPSSALILLIAEH